jgi:hypothetical protein
MKSRFSIALRQRRDSSDAVYEACEARSVQIDQDRAGGAMNAASECPIILPILAREWLTPRLCGNSSRRRAVILLWDYTCRSYR